jgi:hypothetical protein
MRGLSWSAGLAMLACALASLPAQAEERVIDLSVQGGKPVGGARTVRLARDDDVVLNVRADTDDEVHLHGYNMHLHLKRGQPATLRFTAKRTGRFSAELHKADTELVVFEIYPK